MGFGLSRDIQAKVVEIVSDANWDQEGAVVIPDAAGMVLVKQGSKAFLERKEAKGVFMTPATLRDSSSGEAVELTVWVCTA